MSMKSKSNDVSRGVSNSPLTSTLETTQSDNKPDMEVKIDWFQVTFDFIKVTEENKRYFTFNKADKLYLELLNILKRKESPYDLQSMDKGLFGYYQGIYIDEFIWLSYGGKKNKNEKYPMTLTISGTGCRVFEKMGGIWSELFTYFQHYGVDYLKVGRIDIAIDDFSGKHITPYDIWPVVRKGHVVTQFRKVNLFESLNLGSTISSDGYTITFGPRGANQLQIYDKKLERNAKNEYDYGEDVWYRYEMRFVDDKARQVMDMYTVAVKSHNSKPFMRYAKQLLLTSLELKVPSNDSNKSRWTILPAWKRFINSIEKINLNTKGRHETTIERKLEWFKADMHTTIIELFIVYGEDFGHKLYEMISDAKFQLKHLNRLNDYLRESGKKEITLNDIKKIQHDLSMFKTKKDGDDKN